MNQRPRTNPLTTPQLNLPFCDSKPMTLPKDKAQELAIALADLLLNATVEPRTTELEEQR
jgi:hypothetical protein